MPRSDKGLTKERVFVRPCPVKVALRFNSATHRRLPALQGGMWRTAEVEALREALDAAATSLQSVGAVLATDPDGVVPWSRNRALVARAALAPKEKTDG